MEPGLSSRERLMFTGDLPATFGGQAHPIAGGHEGNGPAVFSNFALPGHFFQFRFAIRVSIY